MSIDFSGSRKCSKIDCADDGGTNIHIVNIFETTVHYKWVN